MTSIDNPWRKLDSEPADGKYVLEIDRIAIEQHSRRFAGRTEKEVVLESLPEPFIGDPTSARLVLLGLNPYDDSQDKTNHRRPDVQKAIFHNLRHESQAYPFYAFDPAFRDTGVSGWWRKRTKQLQEAAGLDDSVMAQKLLVIEWFPYHSKKWFYSAERFARDKKPICPSQRYSFGLAKTLLCAKDIVVLGMRSRKYWINIDKRFAEVPFLNSWQNTCISKGNMDRNLFSRIVNMLRE